MICHTSHWNCENCTSSMEDWTEVVQWMLKYVSHLKTQCRRHLRVLLAATALQTLFSWPLSWHGWELQCTHLANRRSCNDRPEPGSSFSRWWGVKSWSFSLTLFLSFPGMLSDSCGFSSPLVVIEFPGIGSSWEANASAVYSSMATLIEDHPSLDYDSKFP